MPHTGQLKQAVEASADREAAAKQREVQLKQEQARALGLTEQIEQLRKANESIKEDVKSSKESKEKLGTDNNSLWHVTSLDNRCSNYLDSSLQALYASKINESLAVDYEFTIYLPSISLNGNLACFSFWILP